ncbi:UNVERIFIED_ORG: hypothetical protein ABID75_005694 [Bacillus proteolyticus]
MVNVLKGESFGFLGFDLRRIPNRNKNGFFVFMNPKKKARTTVKAKNSRTHSKRRSEVSTRLNKTNQCRTDWMGELLPGWEL